MRIQTYVTGLLMTGLLSASAFAAPGTPPPAIKVVNHAQTASTVKVVSGPYQGCAGVAGIFNIAGSTKVIPGMSIDMFCGDLFPCKAEVYLGDKHDCSGASIGTVQLERDGTITVLNMAAQHQIDGGQAIFTVNQ